MIFLVPYLIDGNNLIFALHEVGPEVDRLGLCELLDRLAARGERVCVIFDGPPPDAPTARILAGKRAEAIFPSPRSADALLLERIAANSAPRRLTVVSSDREIRRAAARRRCKVRKSEEFAVFLVKLDQDRKPPPDEPPEKRHGLSPEQVDAWLEEFEMNGDNP